VLETEQRRKETNCKRLGYVQPKSSSAWHTGLSGGAPDKVRCARLVSGENAALRIRRRCTAIIHRTVWWCTGLSSESSAANSSPLGKAKRRRGYNAPDCPVSQRSPAPTVDHTIFARHMAAPTVGRGTGLSGVHWTVSGAPTGPKLQRSTILRMERNRAPDINSSCPVVHRTVWCATRQKARMAFQVCLQRLLAALGL
jgi:hypothetical protein